MLDRPANSDCPSYHALLSEPAELAQTVHRAVRAACPPCLREQAEDIGQTVLARLLARKSGQPAIVLTRGYALSAARNAVIDELRSRRRHTDGQHALATQARGSAAPDDRALELRVGRLGHRLSEALADLSESQRRALELYLVGYRLREIAEHMDWPAKRADNVVFRTLGRLRSQLAPAMAEAA